MKIFSRKSPLFNCTHLGFDSISAQFVLVQDHSTGQILYSRNANQVWPIASITKLMTAMVVLNSNQDLSEPLTINTEDIRSRSKLEDGALFSRQVLLLVMLMSSENAAASALGRCYQGGTSTLIDTMNQKAHDLGMINTRFVDSSGLSSKNFSTLEDLLLLLNAAENYPLIRSMTTSSFVKISNGNNNIIYKNRNPLIDNPDWKIVISKTGRIPKSGYCLIMRAWINNKLTNLILLNTESKIMRIVDAMNIKRILEMESGD